jgi:hypothetical protein
VTTRERFVQFSDRCYAILRFLPFRIGYPIHWRLNYYWLTLHRVDVTFNGPRK